MEKNKGFNFVARVCYKPKGDEKGEDAYAFDCRKEDIQSIAVFDGCGGAGSWKYPEYNNSTGAYIAAQVVSGVYQEWASGLTPQSVTQPEQLKNEITEKIGTVLAELKGKSSKIGIGGSLVKAFPCTLSAAIVTPREDEFLLTALNAGDSRVYFLTPEAGLIQYTRDDLRGNPDGLANLRGSAPMSNMINADKPFRIDCRQLRIPYPAAVICATDGIFGYLRSPMDLEYLLLRYLMESKCPDEFEKKFEAHIRGVTGDDSTALMAFYGWNSYGDIQKDMAERYEYVSGLIRTLDAAADGPGAENVLQSVWETYKKETVYDEMPR